MNSEREKQRKCPASSLLRSVVPGHLDRKSISQSCPPRPPTARPPACHLPRPLQIPGGRCVETGVLVSPPPSGMPAGSPKCGRQPAPLGPGLTPLSSCPGRSFPRHMGQGESEQLYFTFFRKQKYIFRVRGFTPIPPFLNM